jgi:hypothetical protein
LTKQLKVYGDTNTLRDNADDPAEVVALKKLAADSRLEWWKSNIVDIEVNKTRDETKRNSLSQDSASREKVKHNENLLPAQMRVYSSSPVLVFSRPLSEVFDPSLQAEIMQQGIKRVDAQHLTQAGCNDIDVFLTTDNGIIKKRAWLEQRLKRKIRLPSELVEELTDPK